jgi:salicylate hydroxylase
MALAAKSVGLDPTVFEQSHDFRRVDGGIALQPNGLCVLDAIGVLERLRPHISPVDRILLQRSDGRLLGSFDYRGLAGRHRHIAVLARFELQEHLLSAALDRGICVRFGRRCTGLTREKGGAILHFAAGPEHECDVIVGADGINSVVRTSLALRSKIRSLGLAALRGTVDVPCNECASREIWGHDGRLFGIAPLPNARTYFYCSAPLGDWTAVLDYGLQKWIASWDIYGREVRNILGAVTDWGAVNYDEIRDVRVRPWYRTQASGFSVL